MWGYKGKGADMGKADNYMIDRASRKRRFLSAGILALMLCLFLMPAEASAARISKGSKTILKGQTFTLYVKGTGKKAKWSSSKQSVASVSSSGVVRGKKAGKAVITAKIGKKKYKCKVTVRQPVSRITLNKTSVSLKKGKTAQLKANVKPGNAYKKTITWKSSNGKVAAVSKKGKVTAKAVGTAVITAHAKDGSGVVASCTVEVYSTKKAQSSLTLSANSMELYQGQSKTLSASVTSSQLVWACSNYAVASVGVDGTVVGVAPGEAQIMAATADGKVAYCKVTVLNPGLSSSAQAQKFLSILAKYSAYVETMKKQGRYLAYSNSSSLNKNTWSETVSTVNSRGIAYTNCAHMIRLALREMGKLGENQNFWGDGQKIHFNTGVRETLEQSCQILQVNKSVEQLLREGGLLPGDICIWDGTVHTNVYAGKDALGQAVWYDAGRGTDGGTGRGGSYMTHAQIKKGGVVTKAVLDEDVSKDGNNPDLKNNIYVFNSFGPHGIALGPVKIGYIIRLVK